VVSGKAYGRPAVVSHRHANLLSQKLAFGVTQWVVISVLLWIATAGSLAAGTYCVTSRNFHFAHIWVSNCIFSDLF
jgi:hypothetical protein